MNVEAYLQRIGYEGPRDPAAETLRRLQRAHLYTVPFENLDITLGRPLALELPHLFEKIVKRRRGGFCYELNGLFGWLLERLGFAVHRLAARVFHDDGTLGPERDHMLLLVEASPPRIADVGFGDSFLDPLVLSRAEQAQPNGDYRLRERSEGLAVERRERGADWRPQYAFSLAPRALEDFREMCRYQESSADSPFTRKSVCSRATPSGRVTLANDRLIVTVHGRREERPLRTVGEYRALLGEHFGIELDDGASLERLLSGRRASGSEVWKR